MTSKNVEKNYEKKVFWDPPGFKPGTFRSWSLHARKKLLGLVFRIEMFPWYLNQQLVFRRFLHIFLPK